MKRWLAIALTGFLIAGCGRQAPGSNVPKPSPAAGPFIQSGPAASVEQPAFKNGYAGVFFTDPNHGWLAVARTTVGGSGGGSASGSVLDQAANGTSGSGQTTGYVALTADGGKDWDWVSLGSVVPKQIDFIDGHTGWVLADDRLLATTDGGRTWHERYHNNARRLVQISFLDRDRGYMLLLGKSTAAGEPQWVQKTELQTTSDGGRTWAPVTVPHVMPSTFAFTDANTGWVAGTTYGTGASRAAIYATTDGGRTWHQQLTSAVPQDTTPGGRYSVWFNNARSGWAELPTDYGPTMGGAWGPLYHTTDGGRHWEHLQDQSWAGGATENPPGWPGDIRFVNAQDGWIPAQGGAGPGQGGVAFTHDGGKTWQRSSDFWDAMTLVAPGKDDVWVTAQPRGASLPSGLLLHSTDGGETWEQVLPAPAPRTDITFLDAQHGFGIGTLADRGGVVATADGGSSWRLVGSFPDIALSLIAFADNQTGWVLGGSPEQKLFRTTDGGATWQPAAAPKDPVVALQFFDRNNGLCVTQPTKGSGLEYNRLTTKDGGASWQDEGPLATTSYLTTVRFVSPQVGFALRSLGKDAPQSAALALTTTRDGGKTWADLGTLPLAWKAPLGFLNASQGWMFVGQEFLTTADGGRTWTSHPLKGVDPAAASFVGATQGWLLSQTGALYRTTDGGLSWAP